MASKKSVGVVRKPVPMSSGPVLIALASLRNTEAQLRWQGAQWAITLNVSAMVALIFRLLVDIKPTEIIALAVGCVTVAMLNVTWYVVLRRDGKFFAFWNKKILEHEKKNGVDGGSKIFCSIEYQRLSRSRTRIQRILERVTIMFIGFWMLFSIGLLIGKI